MRSIALLNSRGALLVPSVSEILAMFLLQWAANATLQERKVGSVLSLLHLKVMPWLGAQHVRC